MRKPVLCVSLFALGMLAGCGGGSAAPSNSGGTPPTSGGQVVLKAISVLPSNSSITPFTTEQFTAMGTYSDGTTKDLTSQVSWNSTPNTVSTVSDSAPTKGLVRALAPGVSVITVTSGSVVNLTQLTVAAVNVQSIIVTPATADITSGSQQQFAATATFSDGSSHDVTNSAIWSSDNPAVATVTTGTGLATARTMGSANISATLGAVTSGTPANPNPILTVNGDNLVSVAIQPGSSSIAAGTKLQFAAIGLFNDGSTRDLSSLATWTSSDTKVAAIGQTTGLAGPGKFTSKSADYNTTAIAASVTFPLSTSDTCAGTTSGTLCSFTSTTNLGVVNPTVRSLQSITLAPSTASVAPGTQVSFTALGTFSDSTTQDLTNQVTWSANSKTTPASPACANASMGRPLDTAIGTAAGNCYITATSPAQLGFIFGPADLTVTAATLTSLAITGTPVAAPGSSLQLAAIGTFSDQSTRDITGDLTWSSSDSTIASIGSKTGIVTGEGVGSAFITATILPNSLLIGSSVSTVTTNVLVEPVKSMTITAPAQSFAANSSIQLTAIGTFADGNTQYLTPSAIWSTAPDETVATIGSAPGAPGVVMGLTAGSVTVTASFSGVTATLPLTVATLKSIAITDADSLTIISGSSDQLTATGTLSDGTTQDLTKSVAWSSSNPAVAVVDSNGLATGTGKGASTITVTFGQSPAIQSGATLNVN